MLDDAELFEQLCEKYALIPESDIVEAVKLSCSTGELRLSHTSIIAGLCEIIAQVLSSSSTIKLVDLSDCMLLAKGLSCIIKALSEGSSVTSLYLKGNNIGGALVEQLGQMLSYNNTLKAIHIEWNNLGSHVDSFAKFCDGLSKNHNLEELDLKYNQISTLCADHFAKALKHNKSLKKLDLSWNSLGMSGGQKILQGVQHNRFLICLNLKGNCIPNEIYSTIKDRIIKNQKRQLLCETPIIQIQKILNSASTEADDDDGENDNDNDYNRRESKMRLRLRKKKKKREITSKMFRDSPLGDSGNDDEIIEIRRASVPISKKLTSKKSDDDDNDLPEVNEKVQALNRIIQERAVSMDLLQAELVAKEEELKTAKSDNERLRAELGKLEEEKETELEEKSKELDNLKKSQAKAEESWKESYTELEEAHQSSVRLRQQIEAKCRAYEKEARKVSLEAQSAKEKHNSAVQSYEDTISELRLEAHRAKRELQEREGRHRAESGVLKETLRETSGALEKCQEQLQKLKTELHDSVELQAKLKMRTDEAERIAGRSLKLEDALGKTKEDKEKLEDKLQESRRAFAQLQKQMIRVQEESLEPQRKHESLKLELHVERERVAALRVELQDERNRTREQTDQLQKMLAQVNGLYAQLAELQSVHGEALRTKDAEIDKLKNVVAQKTRELEEFRSEQVQRAHQFQAAISKYFGSN